MRASSARAKWRSARRLDRPIFRFPHETMMADWKRPEKRRNVPPAPKLVCAPDDIRKVAELIAKARNPVMLTEAVGRDAEAFHALVALSDKASLPVVERPGAIFANFPKDHPMHQGHDFNRFWGDTDLAIVIARGHPGTRRASVRRTPSSSISMKCLTGHIGLSKSPSGYLSRGRHHKRAHRPCQCARCRRPGPKPVG